MFENCSNPISLIAKLIQFNYSTLSLEFKFRQPGYNWSAGTQFYFNITGILQHPSYWEDPEKFIPERFFDDQLNKDLRNLLFGFGVRNCPGYKSSMIELQCFLCLLFRKYDIELVDPNVPLKTVIGFLTACLELPVRIKLRK
ncbi:unnamed protein product [Rhizophagus irregularis]|nr:unnamed protein product [Rhizophagus irregularis]